MTPDEVDFDWSVTTWRGNRLRQHREFQALSFREKIRSLEQMAEVAEWIRSGTAPRQESDSPAPHPDP